ncbi:hypothetical protein PYCC9005_002459 [Savitreella phatthalungensis]
MAQGGVRLKKSTTAAASKTAVSQVKRGSRVAAPKKARAVQDATRVKKHSKSSNTAIERRLAAMAGNAGAKLRILAKEETDGKIERDSEIKKNDKKKLR